MADLKCFFNPMSAIVIAGRSGKWKIQAFDLRDECFFLPTIRYKASTGYILDEHGRLGERMEYWLCVEWLRFHARILIKGTEPDWRDEYEPDPDTV